MPPGRPDDVDSAAPALSSPPNPPSGGESPGRGAGGGNTGSSRVRMVPSSPAGKRLMEMGSQLFEFLGLKK